MECLREKFTGGALLNGRYQTISPLNHGSFGMVFMAQDLRTNNNVAIKCLTKQATANDCGMQFAVDEKSEELVLHSRLASHPNIVNLIDSFETDAHIYLVLEFCAQGDLYEAIRNGHGPLETEHVRQFMLQLVDAVEYIHSKGVYHRDIKPENVFLSQDGAMKLGDFGLATTEKWSFEMTVGSDRYMAPEQFDSAGAGYSPAQADIWAIGVCLLNILFSRNPFTTPTEADPIFLDFSRDKQSLFDVFPSMSQDTYEVIVECMNLDPKRRSLVGAREALLRTVSFTTEDEALDDFCGADKAIMASANREPLRTPSIQSPAIDNGAFPWTKALHAIPHQGRQLTTIVDNESYSEDLFSKSEATADWCSPPANTPSIASVMDSHLGVSMNSLAIKMPSRRLGKPSPMVGSLPITMGKAPMPSMASVFGRGNDAMSKSWSDMWEEDEEEEERAQMQAIKSLNARTWSQESKGEVVDIDDTEPLASAHSIKGDVDDDLAVDDFFFQDSVASNTEVSAVPRYSPPSKRIQYDKWAALGERRRARGTKSEAEKSPSMTKTRRHIGFGIKSYEAGVLEQSNHHNNHNYNKAWAKEGKDRIKESPLHKTRDWNWRQKRYDLGDVEWVGGW
jgi:serine/threonine protein kinase